MVWAHATPEPHVGPPTATPTVTAADASCSTRRLHVWVVGNPVSGGKRGAAVLEKLEMRLRREFGNAAVHSTSSSGFLRDVLPHGLTPTLSRSASDGSDPRQPSTTAPPAGRASAPSPSSASTSCHAASVLSAVWAATGASTSTVAASVEPVVRTLVIRTDQGGHTKAVSHALCRLILRSRLEEDAGGPALEKSQQQQQHWQGAAVPLRVQNGARPVAAPVATHHVVLVVGGDGTLSEVANGMCDGTLAAFAALTSRTEPHLPSDVIAGSPVAVSSHARVEREAVVLSHLLPAVLYVPGGTGSDFAKLGLCCHSVEDAVRLVREGLLRQLFGAALCATAEGGSCGEAANTEGFGERRSCTPGAVAVPPLARSPALRVPMLVAAYAVDVGRIEFLRTGHRHFFINECSTGMSCDVIQRGERFKQSRWISKLGGLLLFAASALVSLFLMTPKPLYICRLPARTRLKASSPPSRCDGSKQDDVLYSHSARDSAEDGVTDASEGTAPRPCDPSTRTRTGAVQGSTEATSPCAELLTAHAPFAPVGHQIRRLRAQLRRSEERSSSNSTSTTITANSTTGISSGGAATLNGDAACAYAVHAATSMPPLHAKTVRCTLQTPSDRLLQLLDLTDAELLASQRAQQQQPQLREELRRTEAAAGDAATAASPLRDDVAHRKAVVGEWASCGKIAAPLEAQQHHVNHSSTVPRDEDGGAGGDDDLAALTWVEMPSSMVAFANGRWYGGGMLVAPHANPTDGLLSCTNWVATILPFISGVASLYTGLHVHWRTTTAFDGERFLITGVPPTTTSPTASPSLRSTRRSGSGAAALAAPVEEADKSEPGAEALCVEADGEVLEAVPAIVEIAGKLTFLVPATAAPILGTPAPGTARERAAGAEGNDGVASRRATESGALVSTRSAQPPLVNRQLRRLREGLGGLWRRSVAYVQQRRFVTGERRRNADAAMGAPRGDEDV